MLPLRRFAPLLVLSGILMTCTPVRADLSLPNVFSDHMVLQRDADVPVWGKAIPGEIVTVSLGDLASAEATAGADGKWMVKLPPQQAGGPWVLTISGENTIRFEDVLIGEVWLCSGQSNMEWTVGASHHADAEINAANFPKIRHLKVPRVSSTDIKEDQPGTWQVCSPETVANFSGVGYFFARRMQQELDVPIGLLGSNWGGSRIEPWTPIEGFAQVESLQSILHDVQGRTPDHPRFQGRAGKYLDSLDQWRAAAKKNLAGNEGLTLPPTFPQALLPYNNFQSPTVIYNGMIAPLIPYAIRGAIWYQGEGNHLEKDYTEKTIALVEGWREMWQPELPFYYVQIAPYNYRDGDQDSVPEFWEQQAAAAEQVADSGMVVINDIGNAWDVHPTNKQDVGLRLANLALTKTYGRTGIPYSGPKFRAMTIEGSSLRVSFDHAASGLASRDGNPLTHFELIGAIGDGWQPAIAAIDGDTVVLTSPKVTAPVAMRFAWNEAAEPNLMNKDGLPAGAFRAGTPPEPKSALEDVAAAANYEVLYDLDLKNLSDNPQYTTNRSSELTGDVDRIAYLLELKQDGETLWVYVSMDAFTQDLKQLALPTTANGNSFQQSVSGLEVHSSVSAVTEAGTDGKGNIEMWPNNYKPDNAAAIPEANGQLCDFGDAKVGPVNGHGCLQIHATSSKMTLLAINDRRAGENADLGVGNCTGQHPDWTFAKNAAQFQQKRLRILVRLK